MGADAHFLVFPEIFKTRLWLGHSRTFTELSISYSCCVIRVTVLLEGEPSVQSKDLKALDWVCIKAISIFWCIELFFYSDESLCPCCWKTAPQYEAATSTLYFGMVLSIWWALHAVFFTSMLGLCSNMHYQLLVLSLRRVYLSKSYPLNWICHRFTSLKVW